jgi:ATP-dependent Clp protease protease subunit
MLQQPRVPPTGQRQAIEIQIKWREVLEQKQALLRIMNKTTGHSIEKLDHVHPPQIHLTGPCMKCFPTNHSWAPLLGL